VEPPGHAAVGQRIRAVAGPLFPTWPLAIGFIEVDADQF